MNTFVICHNPTQQGQGNVKWEGHNVIGYVDVTPVRKLKTPPNAPYYNGWATIPPTLKGTADVVLSLYCPVAGDFNSGAIASFDEKEIALPNGETIKITTNNDIFVKAFDYVKPGGVMLFAGWGESIKTKNGTETPSWTLLKNTFGEGNLSFGTFAEDLKYGGSNLKGQSFLQIRKPTGGRRRKTRRVHRKNSATSRVYRRVQRRLWRTRSMNSSSTRLK